MRPNGNAGTAPGRRSDSNGAQIRSLPGRIESVLCQRTLKSTIHCSGIGLHSGRHIHVRLLPAAPDTGIRFRRVDVAGRDSEVAALWSNVTDTLLCTTLGNEAGVKVATVEHMMAALAGAEIDNAVIELDGPELPIMDGSAAPFMFLFDCAGLVEQRAPRRVLRVRKAVEVEADDGRRAALRPYDGFALSFAIDFRSKAVSRNRADVVLRNGTFRRELARARTFGFEHEVEELRKLGLAQGGSLDNAVVIGRDDRVLNDGGLRYDDDFVRHKMLDAVGDMYLAGAPLQARFVGDRSGHGLNNRLLRALFADPAAWEYSFATVPEQHERATSLATA